MISGRLERYAINAALALVLMGVAAVLLASPSWAQNNNFFIQKEGPARVELQDGFTYTLEVSTTNSEIDGTIVVEDVLPEGVAFNPDGSSDSCEDSPNEDGRVVVRCDVTELVADGEQTIRLNVTAPKTPGLLENEAVIRQDNNIVARSDIITTTAAPNLDITKEDFPDPVDVEEVLLYTIVVENEGDEAENDPVAQNVTVVDDLPDTVDLIDTDIIGSENGDDECEDQFGDDTLECDLGDIGPGEEVRVEIRVRAEEEGEITNIARVFVDNDEGDSVLVGIADESTEVTANDDDDNGDDDNGDDDNGDDDDNDGNGSSQYDDFDEDLDDFNEDLDRLDSDLDDLEELLDDNDDDNNDEEIVFLREDDADGEVLDTSAVDKLPNTGGLSIIAVAAGLALLVTGAGVSLWRLGRGWRRGG